MRKPDFDSIKSYDQFQKYKWNRTELIDICKEHGLLFIGSDKKLNKVIEAYLNGEIIPPRRNWYTNKILLSFVNENGLLMTFDIVLLLVNLLFIVIGIINYAKDTDDLYYTPFFVFGITGLIVAGLFIHWGRDLIVIKSYIPTCGDKKFTRAQVDEHANSDGTEWLKNEGILLTPDILIGVSAGISAIAYEDIASLHVEQKWHTERIGPKGSNRYRDYYTYKIFVRTNKGKKIAISECGREWDVLYSLERIYEQFLKRNLQVEFLDMKKSPLAPDDSAKEVTEGTGLRQNVEKSIKDQSRTQCR